MNFNKLSQIDKVKEVQKLSKRANERLRSQERKNLRTSAYYSAKGFATEEQGKNYFYQGKKYVDESILNDTYKELTKYLSNTNQSTIRGIKTLKKQEEQRKIIFDKDYFATTSKKDKIKEMQRLSKNANKKLRELEKNGMIKNAYEVATEYTKQNNNSKRFYTGLHWQNEHSLNLGLKEVNRFLSSVTSTPSGYNLLYNETLERFRNKGIDIQEDNEKEFFDFLKSDTYKKLQGYGDSGTFIEDFVKALNKKISAKDIEEDFKEFMKTNKTIDYFEEKVWGIVDYNERKPLH